MNRLVCAFVAAACLPAVTGWTAEAEGPVGPGLSPYVFLIRDPDVHAELGLTSAEVASLRAALDEVDGLLLSTRNKSTEEGTPLFEEATATARLSIDRLLSAEKRRRLSELVLQAHGTRSLLLPDVILDLNLTEKQLAGIRSLIVETDAKVREAGEKQSKEAGSEYAEQVRKLRTAEQRRILGVLSRTQTERWKRLVGRPAEIGTFGDYVEYKAPEFSATGTWIDSPPATMEGLRGRVVVVHFYAFGCINCIHNYPWYKEWQRDFAGRDVTIVGIQTPETKAEREIESVRRKAREEGFEFPILMDSDNASWNAWGNSMWPTVYLVDKRGYIRWWWMGELDWQGAGRQKEARKKIEELLAEPAGRH